MGDSFDLDNLNVPHKDVIKEMTLEESPRQLKQLKQLKHETKQETSIMIVPSS